MLAIVLLLGLADRVVFMDEERNVETAPPQDFFDNPQHPRAQQFLSQIVH